MKQPQAQSHSWAKRNHAGVLATSAHTAWPCDIFLSLLGCVPVQLAAQSRLCEVLVQP